ncbi:Sec-independent protein translocase family protein [Hamadaea tsunoensis]|uniref:preprotein translocase subunit TatB n=1 Tax=Hamadaea tsunoensis TaxID=53368 RepID=UPI00040EEE11|nr:preprotein translocase subunit TatB [Hamadaea tsunoensis]
MFENLNGWEFFALLLLALLIFGDKLPQVISDGLRMLRNLRNMARNATGDLSKELGTDISLEDLNPKNFVRKHLLSEEDEATLRKPLEGLFNDVKKDVQGIGEELKATAKSMDHREPIATPAKHTPLPSDPTAPPAASRYIDAT